MTSSPSSLEETRRRARAAYERARVRVGVLRGLVLAAIAGTATLVSQGHANAGVLALVALAWTAIEWRGGPLLRSARVGAGVGLLALVVPLWAFRSCCRAGDAMMGSECCSMTGACTLIGAAFGLTLAVFLVRTPRKELGPSTLGMGFALLAVASVRCTSMLAGEALGMMGGLAAGAMASSLVAAVVDRARRTV